MAHTFTYDDIFHDLLDDLETEIKDLHLDDLYENFEAYYTSHTDNDNQFVLETQQTTTTSNREEEEDIDDNKIFSNENIPHYLLESNSSFQVAFFSYLRAIYHPINSKDLQQLAILTHHMSIINLHQKLWYCYLKFGNNQLKKPYTQHIISPVAFQIIPTYPKIIQAILISKDILNVNNYEIYIRFIEKYLQYLDHKEKQYRTQFNTIKKRISNYTNVLNDKIDEYVRKQGVLVQQLYYELKIALMEYISNDQFYQFDFFQQHPTETQLKLAQHICAITLEKEKAAQEYQFFQLGVFTHRLPKLFDLLLTSMPTSITSISDVTIRQRLTNEYQYIIDKAKADLMKVLTSATRAKKMDSELDFQKQMAEIWKKQHQLHMNERLTNVLLTLIEKRQKNIIECIKNIYELKARFLIRLPP